MKQLHSLAAKAGFLFIISTGAAPITKAQAPIANVKLVSNKIQFIGVEGDMLVFELLLNDLPKEGSWLRITDENRTLIFEERIKSSSHSKRYKVIRNSMNKIQFEIFSKQTLLKESFNVNLKMEEKWEVIKAR
jgi:hypothetical protein